MEGGWRAEGGETDQKVLRGPETRLNLENMRKRVRKRDIKRECVREKSSF